MINDWAKAWDSLCQTIGAAADPPTSGYFDDLEHLTTDQRLKVAEIAALLAVAQEINHLRHYGINPDFNIPD